MQIGAVSLPESKDVARLSRQLCYEYEMRTRRSWSIGHLGLIALRNAKAAPNPLHEGR